VERSYDSHPQYLCNNTRVRLSSAPVPLTHTPGKYTEITKFISGFFSSRNFPTSNNLLPLNHLPTTYLFSTTTERSSESGSYNYTRLYSIVIPVTTYISLYTTLRWHTMKRWNGNTSAFHFHPNEVKINQLSARLA